MINIYDDLVGQGVPIYAEGDAPEVLPDEYFTYSEDSTAGGVYADNEEKTIVYEWTLKWYTKNAANLYTGLCAALHDLKAKGYIVSGVGYSNGSYKDTWFSRRADVKIIEYLGG